MQMTSLIIAPEHSYRDPGPDNPMRCVVKLKSDRTTVECVLSDETMQTMVNLVANEVARNSAANMAEFCQQVATFDVPLIGSS